MACVFGIANHSPETVVKALLKSRLARTPAEIGIVSRGSQANTACRYLLFLNKADLFRNASVLAHSTTKAFIFANPIDLSTISGVHFLDFQVSDDQLCFSPQALDIAKVRSCKAQPLHRAPNTFLPRLVEQARLGSLLNPMMAFIYSLSAKNQLSAKLAVANFLYFGWTKAKLHSKLAAIMTERSIAKLYQTLHTDTGAAYGAALSLVRKARALNKPYDLSKIVAETHTSSYEVSYLLAVLDAKGTFSDSFDRAKNRKKL